MKRRRRKKGRTAWLNQGAGRALVIAGICLAVVMGVLLPILFFDGDSLKKPVSSLPASSVLPQSVPLPQPDFSIPISIVSEIAEEAPYPLFGFTGEEVDELNAFLDEWAAQPTVVRVTKDAEGNDLEEPYEKEDGGNKVAVWFLDIESGAYYGYNTEQPFYYASTMKAPYAAYLYTLADAGQLDLNEMLTVSPSYVEKYKDNTGVLKEETLPADYSVEQLIGFAIRSSDTIALRVLLNRFPAGDFVQWATELGLAHPERLHSVIYGEVDASDMGLLLCEMYDYMQHGQHGAALREHMLNAGNNMIKSEYPVAHKYGWDEHAYHDMAVVYAQRPYLIVVMTDKWGGGWAEMVKFAELTAKLEAMVTAKWAAHGG